MITKLQIPNVMPMPQIKTPKKGIGMVYTGTLGSFKQINTKYITKCYSVPLGCFRLTFESILDILEWPLSRLLGFVP